MDRASRLKHGANVRSLRYRCANSRHIVAVELLQAAGMMDDGEAFFSKPTVLTSLVMLDACGMQRRKTLIV